MPSIMILASAVRRRAPVSCADPSCAFQRQVSYNLVTDEVPSFDVELELLYGVLSGAAYASVLPATVDLDGFDAVTVDGPVDEAASTLKPKACLEVSHSRSR